MKKAVYFIYFTFLFGMISCDTEQGREYLQTVELYSETMIDYGRDHYGNIHSPLFASCLLRESLQVPSGESLQQLLELKRESWGIRPHDRTLTGANPMHDQNLYQILHALSEISGDGRYALETDNSLQWFLDSCQSETTGLMPWGEHIGWDFFSETTIDKKSRFAHEFFRPWVLWDQCFELAPGPCIDFASGLWNHQIYDQKSGEFSRHAAYDHHQPGTQNQYPRHGGFYLATWAEAYRHTKDTVYLQAIRTLYNFYERNKNPETGAIPGEIGNPRSNNLLLWPQSNLSLAIDLTEAAEIIPAELGDKLLRMSFGIDEIYLSTSHDVIGPEGKGFIVLGNAATLEGEDVRKGTGGSRRVYTDLWTTGYGESTDAAAANICMLRYRQTNNEGFASMIMAAANRYLDTEPVANFPIYPGSIGDVIHLMLNAYELSSDKIYLQRAGHFASRSLGMFFDHPSGLPRASTMHDHYEAITRADNLVMELLRYYVVLNGIELRSALEYTER